MGDLKHLDKNEPLNDIRKKSQELGTKDSVNSKKGYHLTLF